MTKSQCCHWIKCHPPGLIPHSSTAITAHPSGFHLELATRVLPTLFHPTFILRSSLSTIYSQRHLATPQLRMSGSPLTLNNSNHGSDSGPRVDPPPQIHNSIPLMDQAAGNASILLLKFAIVSHHRLLHRRYSTMCASSGASFSALFISYEHHLSCP